MSDLRREDEEFEYVPVYSPAELIIRMQNEAKRPPSGNWFQKWIPGVCWHLKTRCVHGDEIVQLKWRRVVCMVCGRGLKEPLPIICFFTGKAHSITQEGRDI